MPVINPLSKSLNKHRRPLRVYWWTKKDAPNGNFGDELTRVIIEHVFSLRVEQSSAKKCDLVGIGSIIEVATAKKSTNRPYLWSSGFISDGIETITDSDFDIVAVRGQLTRSRVHSNKNIILGDAGLLSSHLPTSDQKIHKVGIIPHWSKMSHPFIQKIPKDKSGGILLIDPTDKCEDVIRATSECETILSTSLHGLIVADSLHIPNIHLDLDLEANHGGTYKFLDYYSIYPTDRFVSITPAQLSLTHLADFIKSRYTPADTEIERTKLALIQSFPYAQVKPKQIVSYLKTKLKR